MSRSQLAPGVEVVAVPGRGLAVRTADGEFLGVRTGAVDDGALLSRLSGTDEETGAGSGAAEDTGAGTDAEESRRGLDRLVGAFEDAGYLAGAPRQPIWPAERRDVLLLGDAALTEPLAAYLRAAGAAPRPATPEEPADTRAAAVVWCLDGPVPEGLWDAADRLPERGVAWLRCHREGWQAYVEPLAAAPGDVTSAHVRARRLAATPAHRELAAYWSGPRTTGTPVRPSPAAAGLLAALLAEDLTGWATDTSATGTPGPLPARRRLRRVDLRTLTITEHVVLPVPDVAAMPRTPATTRADPTAPPTPATTQADPTAPPTPAVDHPAPTAPPTPAVDHSAHPIPGRAG
ncbi:hypothetical protein ACWC10_19245 [Streptomyces sp. NPDC001595]|uniref:hypothetical protein n=1 Tax=Streptomyces sp. NPDC001532 TaxID=3154520 RepID=UPI00331EAD3D